MYSTSSTRAGSSPERDVFRNRDTTSDLTFTKSFHSCSATLVSSGSFPSSAKHVLIRARLSATIRSLMSAPGNLPPSPPLPVSNSSHVCPAVTHPPRYNVGHRHTMTSKTRRDRPALVIAVYTIATTGRLPVMRTLCVYLNTHTQETRGFMRNYRGTVEAAMARRPTVDDRRGFRTEKKKWWSSVIKRTPTEEGVFTRTEFCVDTSESPKIRSTYGSEVRVQKRDARPEKRYRAESTGNGGRE